MKYCIRKHDILLCGVNPRGVCKSCIAIHNKRSRRKFLLKHKDYVLKYSRSNRKRINRYRALWRKKTGYKSDRISNWKWQGIKITWDTHNKLLKKQNNRCAICDKRQKSKALCVDHNHKTGLPRGLLCIACNLMLGIVQKRGLLKACMKYLNKYE